MKYLKRFNEGYSDKGIKTTWQNPYKKNFGKVSLTELIDYLDDNKVPVVNVSPKSLKRYLIKGDRDLVRVEKSDLNFPIIYSLLRIREKSFPIFIFSSTPNPLTSPIFLIFISPS